MKKGSMERINVGNTVCAREDTEGMAADNKCKIINCGVPYLKEMVD